jgi:hypothetical protein
MTPTHSHLVDGTQDLGAQQNALQFMEQADFSKVVSYLEKPEAGPTANEAILQDVPIGSQPPPLTLVAVPAGSSAPVPSAGQTVAFQGQAFISGTLQLVVGFR